MQELHITWGRGVSVWWLLLWRSFLGLLVLGYVTRFVLGFLRGFGPVGPTLDAVVGIIGVLIGAWWLMLVTRMALRKKYKAFRIALVPY